MVARWIAAVMVAVGLHACTTASLPMAKSLPPSSDPNALVKARARGLVTELAGRRWDHPATTFEPNMAAALPPERVRALWESLETAAGPFASIEGVDAVRADALRVANVICAFRQLRRSFAWCSTPTIA